ncbi:hypothetical protein A2U01_0118939, partial [Trifolium medium]|nr:hypothetical protein [Trifolium medium]
MVRTTRANVAELPTIEAPKDASQNPFYVNPNENPTDALV